MHSCKANGPRGKQVEERQRRSRENNSVQGSESCFFFFIEYLLHLVLLLQGNSSAGQRAYEPVKGQKGHGVHLQILLKGNQILLQKKRLLKERDKT